MISNKVLEMSMNQEFFTSVKISKNLPQKLKGLYLSWTGNLETMLTWLILQKSLVPVYRNCKDVT